MDENCKTCKYFDGDCCINQMSESYHCPVTDEMICGGWEYDLDCVYVPGVLDDIAEEDLDENASDYEVKYYSLQLAMNILEEKYMKERKHNGNRYDG